MVFATRALFLLGVILLVAGGTLEGQYQNPGLAKIGPRLVKAGYIVLVIIFAILLAFQTYFWFMRKRLCSSSITVS